MAAAERIETRSPSHRRPSTAPPVIIRPNSAGMVTASPTIPKRPLDAHIADHLNEQPHQQDVVTSVRPEGNVGRPRTAR